MDKATVGLLPLVPKPIVKKVSSRYIAGETLEEAVAVIKDLNAKGACATLDVLGEYIESLDQADRSVEAYIAALEAIRRHGLDSNISVKLSSLGLLLDPEYCFQRVRVIVKEAAEQGRFVRIDMEDSSVTEVTLAIHRRLREEFTNVGVAIQAYMRRTQDDVSDIIAMNGNIRLCKGIYVEPRTLAWKDPLAVNRNFAFAMRRALERGVYVGIATHDERLIWEADAIIRELQLDKTRYEFQMLLGVTEDLRDLLIADGHKLRVYVPFGAAWYAYSTRRLRENPKMAGYVMKSMFSR
ncbi:MAG: proline dehydrogenase [Gemmatimonadetes bacterium]|nr:proline dehydrogenase [Gemmatimonadota bacterium]